MNNFVQCDKMSFVEMIDLMRKISNYRFNISYLIFKKIISKNLDKQN